MRGLGDEQIQVNTEQYLGDRRDTARYASFDFCFNYFHSFYEEDRLEEIVDAKHLQTSCLHIGFYLASWGMFRGASHLLQGSMKHYVPLLEVIVGNKHLFELDVPNYDAGGIEDVRDGYKKVEGAFRHPTTETLVTKVMLGVFGCVPAYDRYFRVGFNVSTFGPKSLKAIKSFYDDHLSLIESYRIPTIDFETGRESGLKYTAAKVIDMIFFVEGQKRDDISQEAMGGI